MLAAGVCGRRSFAAMAARLIPSQISRNPWGMSVTIYHNPGCGTSRNTLGLIRNTGEEPVIVEYLKTPLSKEQLRALVTKLGISVRDLMRSKEKIYAELGLGDAKWSDDDLLGFMAQHPILMNRPVVI